MTAAITSPVIISVTLRWRNNNYIRDDGILPFQRCKSLESYPGASPIISEFNYLNKRFWLLISAVSVWGESEDIGKPKKVNYFELLTFYKERGKSCDLDNGDHCIPDVLVNNNIPIYCSFITDKIIGNEKEETFNSTGRLNIIPAKGNSFTHPGSPTAVSIQCPFTNTEMILRHDKIFLKLKIGNYSNDNSYQSLIDVCYQHVDKEESAVVCTSPIFSFPEVKKNGGFDSFNKYWHGFPMYYNHTLLDTFIAYYATLMKLRVAIYDLDTSVEDYLLYRYKDEILTTNYSKLYYRSRWRLSQIRQGHESENIHHDKVAFCPHFQEYMYEELATITCHWENRIIAKWFLILGVDNYVIPTINGKTLIDVVKDINSSVSGALIPMWWSCKNKNAVHSDNALVRWNNGTSSANLGIQRTVPIGNPRHIQYTNIHYISGIYPNFNLLVDPINFKAIGLKNIHMWGLTKEEPKDCKNDEAFVNISKSVQSIITNSNDDSKRYNKEYFGKSYILLSEQRISNDNNISSQTSLACGFLPSKVVSVKSNLKLYKNNTKHLYDKCLLNITNLPFEKSRLYKSTMNELSIICQYRKILSIISSDNDTSDKDWSLILTDNVILNPFYNSTNFDKNALAALINTSLAAAANNGGLLYFGSCYPKDIFEKCRVIRKGREYKLICHEIFGSKCFHGSDLFIGINCIGLCSYALAIQKLTAKDLFSKLYNYETLAQNGEIDFIRDHYPLNLPFDWALLNLLLNSRTFNSLHAVNIGWNSPWYGNELKSNNTGVLIKLP